MDQKINSAAQVVAEKLPDLYVACAASFTGGLLSQAFASVGSSAEWFRGGVVAYNSSTKRRVLGVGDEPVVSETCAISMATGVRELMDADVAVSITGVGGPSTQEGKDPGTMIIGWSLRAGVLSPGGTGTPPDDRTGAVARYEPGEPEEIIRAGVLRTLEQLASLATPSKAGPHS